MSDYYRKCPERILVRALRKEINNPELTFNQRMEAMKLYARAMGITAGRKAKKAALGPKEPLDRVRLRNLMDSVKETKQ